MKSFLYNFRNFSQYDRILFAFVALLLVSLVYSKFLFTVATYAIFLLAFLEEVDGKWSWNSCLGGEETYRRKLLWRPIFPLFGLFFLVFISAFWSEWNTDFWKALRIKIPYIILGFSFVILPRWKPSFFSNIRIFYLLLIGFSTFLVLINTWSDQVNWVALIERGKSLETPTNHIRYSILCAVGFLLGLEQWSHSRGRGRWFWMILNLYLLLFIHFLAVRTGIVLVYATIGGYMVYDLTQYRRYGHMLLMVMALLGVLVFSYYTIDTFRQKIDYTIYDFRHWDSEDAYKFSDGARIQSLVVGSHVFLEQPVLGAGAGSVRAECKLEWESRFPQQTKITLPHNQFLYVLATFGVLGFVFFMWCFVEFFRTALRFKDVYFVLFLILILISFFVENTLETYVGSALFLTFYLLFMKRNQ